MAKRRKNTSGDKSLSLGKAVSPRGIAGYAYLNEPDQDLNQRDLQKITLFFEKDDPDFRSLVETLIAHEATTAQHYGIEGNASPSCLKTASDYDVEKIPGVKAGMYSIMFSTQAKYADDGNVIPVPVVNAAAQPTSQDVWSGDVARVQFNFVGWKYANKIGVKCYLSGAQLLQSNHEGGGRMDASMFDVDAAFAAAEEGEFTPDGTMNIEDLLN